MQDIKDIGVYNPPVKAIIPVTLPTQSGVILHIDNKPLKAVYDATKSKCEIMWGVERIWLINIPTDAYAKLLFFKLRPTFVVTKELVSFPRKPSGEMYPQYSTKLTMISPGSEGKISVDTVDIFEMAFMYNKKYLVDGDYALGVNVKRENKERLCLIALNENREVVVNYPYQNNDFTQDIGKVDETTWGINIDGVLIDATLVKTAIELLNVPTTNTGGDDSGSGTGTNPGTGNGGGNTGGGTGGTDNPPVEEIKPSYLKLTGFVAAT